MNHHAVVVCGTVLAGLLTGAPAFGQSWTPPRNAFGHPDLEGVWLSNSITPLERPKALEGRDRLADAEVAEFKRRAARLFRENGDSDFAAGDGIFLALLANPVRYTNPNATHGSDGMIDLAFDNRTSLVINRPDGRLPAATAEGRKRQQAAAAAFLDPFVPADTGGAPPRDFTRNIAFEAPLDGEMEAKLLAIADKCPVHRALMRGFEIRTNIGTVVPPLAEEPLSQHERDMEQACND